MLTNLSGGSDQLQADQISRAASSIALNIAEGDFSDPGNGRARFFTAAGSANEMLAGVKVAVAWGHLQSADAAPASRCWSNSSACCGSLPGADARKKLPHVRHSQPRAAALAALPCDGERRRWQRAAR